LAIWQTHLREVWEADRQAGVGSWTAATREIVQNWSETTQEDQIDKHVDGPRKEKEKGNQGQIEGKSRGWKETGSEEKENRDLNQSKNLGKKPNNRSKVQKEQDPGRPPQEWGGARIRCDSPMF
jgi:hypothetical protein